jgi:hypothetical protein
MFKRVIKIILILLAIFLFIVGIIWLLGRHGANKTGKTPLSFRQFLGLGTTASRANTIAGENSATFTITNGAGGANGSGSGANGGGQFGSNSNGSGIGGGNGGLGNGTGSDNGTLGTGNGAGSNTESGLGTNSSQFTNNSTSLNGTGTNGAAGGNGTTTKGTTSTTGNQNTTTDTGATTTAVAAANTPVCSDADTNITFTPAEQTQLNELQNRFYTIAQTLHTDADVETELANHDAFAIKADQVTELYNYCEAQLPAAAAADPKATAHVATPFWHAWTSQWSPNERDSLTFLDFSSDPAEVQHLIDIHDNNHDFTDASGIRGPYGLLNFGDPHNVPVTGSVVKGNTPDFPQLIPVVEKILRINLW